MKFKIGDKVIHKFIKFNCVGIIEQIEVTSEYLVVVKMPNDKVYEAYPENLMLFKHPNDILKEIL